MILMLTQPSGEPMHCLHKYVCRCVLWLTCARSYAASQLLYLICILTNLYGFKSITGGGVRC